MTRSTVAMPTYYYHHLIVQVLVHFQMCLVFMYLLSHGPVAPDFEDPKICYATFIKLIFYINFGLLLIIIKILYFQSQQDSIKNKIEIYLNMYIYIHNICILRHRKFVAFFVTEYENKEGMNTSLGSLSDLIETCQHPKFFTSCSKQNQS